MFRWHQPHIAPNCQGRMLPVATRTLRPPPATIVMVTSGLPHCSTRWGGAEFLSRPNHYVELGGAISVHPSCPQSCWKGSIQLGPTVSISDFHKPGHFFPLLDNVHFLYHPQINAPVLNVAHRSYLICPLPLWPHVPLDHS